MKFFHRLRTQFRKKKLDQELSEEVAFHIEQETQENIAAGMSAEEARYAALRKFGGIDQVKEECRDAWGVRFIDTLLQDIRFGLRMLAKSPGFTAVAVLTLALGIGANTAIFSLINALMLRMLPVRHPWQLVELLHKYPAPDEPRMNGFSQQSYEHFRDNNHVFSGLIGFMPAHFAVRNGGQEAEAVDGEFVVGDYFPVLGMKPAIGRLLGPEDDQKGASGAA